MGGKGRVGGEGKGWVKGRGRVMAGEMEGKGGFRFRFRSLFTIL